jgi:hypothetical protein
MARGVQKIGRVSQAHAAASPCSLFSFYAYGID